MNKMKWGRPELVILAKGKPEESVLKACKLSAGLAESGPGAMPAGPGHRKCMKEVGGIYVDCQARAFT